MKIKVIIFLLFLGFNCFCSNPLKTINAKYYYNSYLELGSNGVSTQQGKKLLIKTYKSAVTEQLDTLVIYSSRLLAEVYLGELNFDSALYYGYIANEKLKSTSLIQEEVKNNINFGITYGISQKYDSAFFYFQKTEDLYEHSKSEIKKEILAWNRIKKLRILLYMKKYNESLVLLDQISEFCSQSNITIFDSEINDLYSEILLKLNNFNKAISYQRKSLKLLSKNDSLSLINAYLSIANLFTHQSMDSSIFYYKKAINYSEAINSNYILNYACITFVNACNLSKSESDFFYQKLTHQY